MKELLLNVLAFVVTAGIIGILAHILGEKLPRAKFDPEKFPYAPYAWEKDGKVYERLGIAKWTDPDGGYFISLDVMEGCAARVAALCKDAGLILTGAGATYPYGRDPHDSNLRIAPSYPSVEELAAAADLLCVAVKLACLEKLTGRTL